MILISGSASAVTYVDHANFQFAGEVGLFAAGLGKHLTPNYTFGMMYGFVPAEVSKGPLIETVTIRQTYRFASWDRMDFYAGLNIFHVLGIKYQTSRHGESPDSYYPIGSIRGLLYLGTELNITRDKLVSMYFEAGINDIWIVNWLANGSEVNPSDHVSLALGLKRDF